MEDDCVQISDKHQIEKNGDSLKDEIEERGGGGGGVGSGGGRGDGGVCDDTDDDNDEKLIEFIVSRYQ